MTNMVYYNVKFPCGYSLETYTMVGPLASIDLVDADKFILSCPLHGKNCPPHSQEEATE